MSADFIRLVANKIKRPILLVQTKTWSESLAFGKQRRCDLFSSILPTLERRKFLDFSQSYLNFPLVIVSHFEQSFINGIADVLDKKLGIQKDYAYVEILRQHYPEINLVEVASLQDGLNKVRDNQLYGMIASLPSVAYTFQKYKISDLMISGQLLQMWNLGIGTRNDEPLLVNIMNKVIAQITEQEQHKITSHWMIINQQQSLDYKLLIQISSIISVLFLLVLYHLWRLKKYNKQLKHLSTTDVLTNISNRIKLDQQLARTIKLAQRYNQQFSLILLDVDHFKIVNDQYGHLVGDYALKAVAEILKENIRSIDTLGRWGGEEFLIICPGQTLESSMLLAEKLRTKINQYKFEHFSNLSCSFGLSSYQPEDTSNHMIQRADDALYSAKNRGRNQVCSE
jgi:diguanylate cyclase (GGDEF)-like protein